MTRAGWIDVDLDGLAKLLERRGKAFAVFELVQNCWDESGVTRVEIGLEKAKGLYYLTVEDDAPEGFQDLTDAYTLFAESKKKPDPTKRGLFNAGEKLVLALCQEAMIQTTTGTVIFGKRGRQVAGGCRERGSRFQGTVKLTESEAREIAEAVRRLIPPVPTFFNGEEIPSRTPAHTFETTLPTVVSDEAGAVHRVRRKTEVRLYEPERAAVMAGLAGAVTVQGVGDAWLYEMGIPVVEIGDKWDVEVQQRVPLNLDRDNVQPSYLKELRVLVLNEMYEKIEKPDATTAWVREASGDERVDDKAVTQVLDLAFGDKRVAFDLSDPEANSLAVAKGYTVVSGGALSGGQWAQAKRAGAILPAGKVTPAPKPFTEGGKPLRTVERADWTPEMVRFAELVGRLAPKLIGRVVAVVVADDTGWRFGGCYGAGELTVNVRHVYLDFPGDRPSVRVLEFLVHEFAHQEESNHLSERYHQALSRLGAQLTRLALDEPELFTEEGHALREDRS